MEETMLTTADRTGAIWFIDNLARVRVAGDETEGRFALVELEGRQGHMPPLHIHHSEDETFVLLDGEITMYVGDSVLHLSGGRHRTRSQGRRLHVPDRVRDGSLARRVRARRL